MYSGYCMVGDFNWSTDEIKAEPYRMDIVNGAWCHSFDLDRTHKSGRVIDHVSDHCNITSIDSYILYIVRYSQSPNFRLQTFDEQTNKCQTITV